MYTIVDKYGNAYYAWIPFEQLGLTEEEGLLLVKRLIDDHGYEEVTDGIRSES